jgi:hypothetical protein
VHIEATISGESQDPKRDQQAEGDCYHQVDVWRWTPFPKGVNLVDWKTKLLCDCLDWWRSDDFETSTTPFVRSRYDVDGGDIGLW